MKEKTFKKCLQLLPIHGCLGNRAAAQDLQSAFDFVVTDNKPLGKNVFLINNFLNIIFVITEFQEVGKQIFIGELTVFVYNHNCSPLTEEECVRSRA